MKKFLCIAALLAALALLVTGCPGGGDPTEEQHTEKIDLTAIFSATSPTQDKATVTIGEDTATFSGSGTSEMWGELVAPEETPWDASDYTGIKFEYKSTGQATIFIQDDTEIFIFSVGGGDWGSVMAAETWQELKLPFSDLVMPDGGWINHDPSYSFNKAAIVKLAFQINEGPANRKFELRNFELTADSSYVPLNPPGVSPGNDAWYLGTAEGGALKAVDNKWTFAGTGDKYVYIYFTPNTGSYSKIKIDFTLDPGQNISWQCVYTADGTIGADGAQSYIDWKEAGPIETDLSIFNEAWSGGTSSVNKATLKGICLVVSLEDEDATTFTLTGVVFE